MDQYKKDPRVFTHLYDADIWNLFVTIDRNHGYFGHPLLYSVSDVRYHWKKNVLPTGALILKVMLENIYNYS